MGGGGATKNTGVTGWRREVRLLTSHRLVRLVVLVGAVLLVVVTMGACGSTATGVETYTDPEYGYSFEYPAAWKLKTLEVTPETIPGRGGALVWGGKVSDVGVLDRDGASVADTWVDLVQVRTYYMGQPIDESNMSSLKDRLDSATVDWGSGVTDVKVLEALTETSLGGMQGFKKTHRLVKDGVPLVTTVHFLFSGPMEYIVHTQAAEENWIANQPVFDALLASFKPGGVATAVSTSSPVATGATSATTSGALPAPKEGERRIAVMGPVTTTFETGGQFGFTGSKHTATVTFKDGSTAEVDDSAPEGATKAEDLTMAWALASTRNQSDVAVEFRDRKWVVVAIY